MPERFEHHARNVALLTLLSRVGGLARDATLSRIFGAGALMDAFFFAFMIPHLFRRLFGEGALAAAFLPVFTELDRDNPALARQFATLLIARLTILLGALVLLGEIIMLVIGIISAGASPALWLMMIMLPYMPLVCLVAILGAMLQVRGRFGPTAASPLLLNLCLITAAVVFLILLQPAQTANEAEADRLRFIHISAVAASVIIAGVLQLAWTLWALRGRGERWVERPQLAAREPFRRVMRQAGPMILGLGVLQLNTFFDGLIASYPVTVGDSIFGIAYPLDTGAMSSISFAQRLYQFPLGVFGIAVATAIFPALARLANDPAGFASTLQRGLRLVIFIGLPASVGLMLIREPITAVLLEGGEFTDDDTRRVAFVLLGYAPAVWAYSMTHVLTRGFYALGDARTPVKLAVAMVALNLALNCTLIWTPLREAGLAWSTAICATLQAIGLLHLLRKRVPVERNAPALLSNDVWKGWLRTIIVTAAMAAVVFVLLRAIGENGENNSWTWSVVRLAIGVTAGMATVVMLALALRMPELPWAIGAATKRPPDTLA